MASITTNKKGRRTIQFFDRDRKRRSVFLGKCSKRQAEAVKVRVECLVSSQITGQPLDDETARWVANIGAKLADKLAKAGLITPRVSHLLAPFLDSYIDGRIDLKPRTIKKLKTTRDYLVEFFGECNELREITAGGADSWRLFLLS